MVCAVCLHAQYNGYKEVEIDGVFYRAYISISTFSKIESSLGYAEVAPGNYSGDVIIKDSITCELRKNSMLDGSTPEYEPANFKVTRIDGRAFINCPELRSITIPESVDYIGDKYNDNPAMEYCSFKGCDNLKEIICKGGKYSSINGCLIKGNYLIGVNCKGEIPDGIPGIQYYAFYERDDLNIVDIPSSIQVVFSYAFYGCKNITSVYCHAKKVPDVFSDSFDPSYKEATLYVPTASRKQYKSDLTANGYTNYWNQFKEILPIDGKYLITYIVDGYEYKDVEVKEGTDITPEAAPEKDGREFSGWSGLPEKMPSDDVTVTGRFKYNIKYMVDGMEYKTVGVFFGDAITPEENPTKKGYTFSGWSEIPEIMPAEDIVITGTFDGTELIKDKVKYKVTDNENNYCKVVGNDNASGEIKIDSVEIDGVYYQPTEVADKAFYGCKDITKIEIPATVANIGERAFANIDKLTDVTCWAEEVPTTDRTAFENSYQDYATLHVVYAAVSKYKEVGPWKDFKDVVAIEGTQRTFVLTYKVDGEVYKTVEIKEGEPITPEAAPTKEGYTFSGWSEIPEIMPSNDVTITGTFIINKYKLIYMVDNEEYKSYEVEYNAAITPEAAPTKEGYTFSGWSEIPEKMPAKDITVTGTFTVNKYQLVYKVDGEVYKSYEMEYGAAITPEAAPTKEGYTFSGWSEIPATMPAHDVTITGTFTINKYKLIYMVDNEEYKSYEIEYNAAITPEPVPTKEGYTFSGWSEIPEKMPDHDVTVTGTFAVNKYQLIYKVDGEVYKSYEVEYGAAITPEADPTKEGYTFSGWSEIPATMPAHDVTITGTFTKGAYKLTYMIDGEVYKTFTYDFGAAITPEPDPTRGGYTFSGWSYIPSTMPAEDVTVTGSFVANKYQLTYMVDGEVYKSYEVAYGTEIEPEPAPTKEGWTFSGWSWIPKKMPAEDVTITGTFTQNQYEAEGGTYVITEDGATVTKGEDKEGEVTIQTTITIDGNTYQVTAIGEGAYKGYTKMSALVIPDGIKAIGASAFEGCNHLRNINIGKGITAIDHKAFSNIGTASAASTRSAGGDGLKVSCSAETVPTADADVFENTALTNATLIVNDNLVESYKATSPWSQFGNIVGFNEASGIDAILQDQKGAAIYSIDGRRLDNARKGLNVIRTSDGRTRKVVVR